MLNCVYVINVIVTWYYTVPNCNIIYLYYPKIKEYDEKKDKRFVIV